jgi:hypothetical protein
MITIKRESDLEIQTWNFEYDTKGHAMRLNSSVREERPSKRHKFRVARKWWRYDRGVAPAIPPDVLDEARRKFVETLKVDG